jgi:hypothetical protein
MKHTLRLNNIKKRTTPKGMRKIVIDGEVFFYRVKYWGGCVMILDSNRKLYLRDGSDYDRSWTPKDISDLIKNKKEKHVCS